LSDSNVTVGKLIDAQVSLAVVNIVYVDTELEFSMELEFSISPLRLPKQLVHGTPVLSVPRLSHSNPCTAF